MFLDVVGHNQRFRVMHINFQWSMQLFAGLFIGVFVDLFAG
jgi:hypothetical protein